MPPALPGRPPLGNQELLVDASGGSTIVVWPRSLSTDDQQQVFDHAKANRWAILRGDQQGQVTTANLFVRMKGASPSYQGGYTPTSERAGVPCYFDDNPTARRWHQVTGDQYVASAEHIGSGAPQGVTCTVAELVDDSCLKQLESHTESTGGSYQALPAGRLGAGGEGTDQLAELGGVILLQEVLGGRGGWRARRPRSWPSNHDGEGEGSGPWHPRSPGRGRGPSGSRPPPDGRARRGEGCA